MYIKQSSDLGAEGGNGIRFVYHAEGLGFQVFMVVLVQVVILKFSHHVAKICSHISEECSAAMLSFAYGHLFVSHCWPLRRPPLELLITPLALYRPCPPSPAPKLWSGLPQTLLYNCHISSSHYCSIHLQHIVMLMMEAVCSSEMSGTFKTLNGAEALKGQSFD
jgi:hypothetical protein